VPSYLFHCRDCLKPFTKQLSLHEYEEGGVVCPLCGSDNVEQSRSVFYAITSKKSA
jgi:putative FmdB family regulatory protein